MVANSKGPNWDRRTVLKSVVAGATVPLLGDVAGAKGPCPSCPDGTALLAKYEWDGEDWVAEEDVGACPDAITEFDNLETDDGDPTKVEYSSKIWVHSVAVKAGPECEVNEDGGTNDDKDGSFEGTVESPNDKAISHINFCAPICIQADFVEGDPIADFDEEGQYGQDRLIAARWDGTSDEHDEPDVVDFTDDDGSYTTEDGCDLTLTTDGVEFNDVDDDDEDEAEVTFTIDSVDADGCELSLVSYVATCPPNYDKDTDGLQVLFDADPDYADSHLDTETVDNTFKSVTSEGEETLTVELPDLEHLELLCDNV